MNNRAAPICLFEEVERTDIRPAKYREESFAYLNISARPPAALIRKTLEEWFSSYPADHKSEFKKSFEAQAGHSAFTELLLFSVFHAFGAKDLIIHPEIEGTNKQPDFKATFGDQEAFVEVKNAADTDDPHIATFCDTLNEKYTTKGFLLDLEFEGENSSTLPVTKFIAFLEENIKSWDREKAAETGNFEDLPKWVFTHNEARIHVVPIPCKDPEKEYERPIGATSPYEAYLVKSADTLRNSLAKKASRYGNLGKPYAIAVNFEENSLDNIDIAQALFGDEEFVFDGKNPKPKFRRKANGLWKPNQNTRVSAVLTMERTTPWSFWQRAPTIWFNPWAANPLDPAFFQGRLTTKIANKETGRLEIYEGENFAQILGLDFELWEKTFLK